jgi:hypothetical protein
MRQLKTWKFVFLILCLSTLAACGTSAQNATLEGSAATPTAAAAPTQAQPPADSGGATPAEAAPGMLSFVIVPGESEARFIIDEVLAGSPNTVVGTTQEIEGQLSVDPQDPAGGLNQHDHDRRRLARHGQQFPQPGDQQLYPADRRLSHHHLHAERGRRPASGCGSW